MCRSRSWSNRGAGIEYDKFLSWEIFVGKYPMMGEIGPENTSTFGRRRQYA